MLSESVKYRTKNCNHTLTQAHKHISKYTHTHTKSPTTTIKLVTKSDYFMQCVKNRFMAV